MNDSNRASSKRYLYNVDSRRFLATASARNAVHASATIWPVGSEALTGSHICGGFALSEIYNSFISHLRRSCSASCQLRVLKDLKVRCTSTVKSIHIGQRHFLYIRPFLRCGHDLS